MSVRPLPYLFYDARARLVYVPGAQGEDDIVLLHAPRRPRAGMSSKRDDDVDLAPLVLDDRLAGSGREVTPSMGASPAGIYLGEEELVGVGEALAELVPEELGPGVPVRLEHHDDPPAQLLERLQGGADLRGMVAVIVVDLHARPPRRRARAGCPRRGTRPGPRGWRRPAGPAPGPRRSPTGN